MPFEPLSWMVSFTVGRVAGRILQASKDKQLAKKLRQTLADWAKNNQPQVYPGALDEIFSTEVDESQPERFTARRRLSETILSERVPSKHEIRNALLERWDEIRVGKDSQDLAEFFQLSRDKAASQFDGLAARIQRVLQKDERLFQVTALELLEDLTNQGRQQAENDSPVFTVPYQRHTCFKGREEILANLRQSFVNGKKTAIAQVIRGLGGIGKTQTAVEYAYKHREEYKAVLWVNAAMEVEIRNDMADAAKLLKIPHDKTDLEAGVLALKSWLEQNSDWLLIFDNADHPELLKPFMPRTPKGHILLTSRASVFGTLGILNPIELPLLSVEDAAEFLLKRTEHRSSDYAEVESARELANELGLLPIALEQAAAYIHELRLSFAAYLGRYHSRRLELLERGQPVMGDYPESVATTWAVNFDEVESESAVSADLLRLSAFLGPDNIPFELILRVVSAPDSSLAGTISESDDPELTIREALRPLTRFSLVTINRKNKSYGTRRLVQEAVKHSLGESGCRAWTERIVSGLSEALKDEDKFVRREAAVALGRIGPEAKAAVPALIEALNEGPDLVSEHAAVTLGRIGPEAKAAVPALIETLNGEHNVCWNAIVALGRIGTDARAAVPGLTEALMHKHDVIRKSANEALRQITAGSLLENIDDVLTQFTASSRKKWVQKALFSTADYEDLLSRNPSLLVWYASLGQPRPDSLSSHLDSDALTAHDAVSLQELAEQISYYLSCFKESANIIWLLSRLRQPDELHDVLSDALIDVPHILTTAGRETSVNKWLQRCLLRQQPVVLDDIVPPLTLDCLVQLRRAIDKHRKRQERDRHRLAHSSEALRSLTVVHNHLDALLTEEELARAMEAFSELSTLDKQIWQLHICGRTMRQIAELVMRSPSTVCERLARAVQRVARIVDAENGDMVKSCGSSHDQAASSLIPSTN